MKNEGTSLGEFEQLVLLAILRLGETAYGVTIRQEIALHTGRDVAAGALYTTLERLESKSLVASSFGDPSPTRGGRAKRFYQVTDAGRTRLSNAQLGFQRMINGLHLIGEHRG